MESINWAALEATAARPNVDRAPDGPHIGAPSSERGINLSNARGDSEQESRLPLALLAVALL